jgi:hypothetical protein
VWVDVIGGGGVDRQAARHPLPSGPHTGGAVRACGAGGRGLAGVWRVRRAVAGLGQPGAAASRRMPGRDCAARRPQPRPDRRRAGLSTCVHECLADECLPGRATSSIDTRTDRLRPRQIQLLPSSLPRCFPCRGRHGTCWAPAFGRAPALRLGIRCCRPRRLGPEWPPRYRRSPPACRSARRLGWPLRTVESPASGAPLTG